MRHLKTLFPETLSGDYLWFGASWFEGAGR